MLKCDQSCQTNEAYLDYQKNKPFECPNCDSSVHEVKKPHNGDGFIIWYAQDYSDKF